MAWIGGLLIFFIKGVSIVSPGDFCAALRAFCCGLLDTQFYLNSIEPSSLWLSGTIFTLTPTCATIFHVAPIMCNSISSQQSFFCSFETFRGLLNCLKIDSNHKLSFPSCIHPVLSIQVNRCCLCLLTMCLVASNETACFQLNSKLEDFSTSHC